MPWQRRRFKGNKVFARTDEAGSLIGVDGRVEIRYKLTDPRVYKAGLSNLERLSQEEGGDQLWSDEEAVPAAELPDRPRKTAAPGSLAPARSVGSASSAPLDPAGETWITDAADSSPLSFSDEPVADGPLNPVDRPPIIIYTDGACSGNPGPAGIGVVLICGELRKEISEYLGLGTNNIAELTAIKRGLELVRDPRRAVRVHADSSYSIGVLTLGWKAKANQALIGEIRQHMRRFTDLRMIKVPGHSGVPENERCDQLARDAITRGK